VYLVSSNPKLEDAVEFEPSMKKKSTEESHSYYASS
jgi:hypothetical protein